MDPMDSTDLTGLLARHRLLAIIRGSDPAACERTAEVLAGAMTPTEVAAAHRVGAAAVKLFPAGSLGPGYVRALRDPFPGLAFVPVGGVGLADVPRYLEAGALAVGVGSPLAGDAPHGGDLGALRARAEEFVATAGEGSAR